MSEPKVLGECVCITSREFSPDLTEIIREGYGAVIVEVPINSMRTVGEILFKNVMVQVDDLPPQAPLE